MPEFHDRRTGRIINAADYQGRVSNLISDIHAALEHPGTPSPGPGPRLPSEQGNLKEPLISHDAPHTKVATQRKASAKKR